MRADDRRVQWAGQSRRLSEVAASLHQAGQFRPAGSVEVRGRSGQKSVAEADVTLDGVAWARRRDGRKYRVAGPALPLRLVVVQVHDGHGQLLAEWLLLTNVRDVPGEQVALWYYWRWRIESLHKLLKSSGLELEEWLQESAGAIAKRLLVACMACVTVWQLQRQATPAAQECQELLMRLSGRQTKRSRPVTTPALLAGLSKLLAVLDVLEEYTPAELRQLAAVAVPHLSHRESG